MNRVALILACCSIPLIITGCQPANITASKWDSGLTAGTTMTRCEEVDMRSNSEMSKTFAKYEGWKLIYLSEYTTGNKLGTSGSACFEKTK